MKKTNKALLEQLIEEKLNECLEDTSNDQELLDSTMELVDRQIEMDKIKKEKIIKAVEVGVTLVAVPLIDYGVKKVFAKMICEFEQDYTFTTTAGRGLASLFKFK